ncbi:MAG: hypothetical protein KIG86_01615 [Eubacteriales bacterium]|nr:hypothetical protein [Eubacteriales bacterium]
MLKYTSYTVVFQEVPDEVSLAFEVSGCPFKCEGCHSPHLWGDVGVPLLASLADVVEQYAPYITCVCFMGGTQNIDELCKALQIVKTYHLKTCVYAGNDNLSEMADILPLTDYLKMGSYQQSLGALNSLTTNQRFYRVEHALLGPELIDTTYLFQETK